MQCQTAVLKMGYYGEIGGMDSDSILGIRTGM